MYCSAVDGLSYFLYLMQFRERTRPEQGARRYPSAPSAIEYLAMAAIGVKWIATGHALGADAYPPYRAPVLTTVAILLAVGWLLLWLRPVWRRWSAIALDGVMSLLVLVDIWYERFYGEVPTVADVAQLSNISFVFQSLLAQLRWYDIFVVADLAVLVLLARRVAVPQRPVRRAVVFGLPLAAAALALPAATIIALDADTVFSQRFQRSEVVGAIGLAGYHLFDTASHLAFPVTGRLRESDERHEAERAVRRRRLEEMASPLAGIARGRNLILISAESLQAFVMHSTIDGRAITPNLNAFAAESLSFSDIYDQTHLGTTAEAEFMALASRLPLASGVVATRYYSNRFRALPHALNEAGYQTFSATAEPPSFWNMRQMHAAIGFSRSVFLPDFKPGEWIGVGLNDVSFFEQVTPMLQQQREPFMAYLLTSSNHHPYRLPPHLQVPDMRTGEGTAGGDYIQSVMYFDRAFGQFMSSLRSSGLLNRSVIVVYGDHQSWLDTEDLQMLHTALNGSLPSALELWRTRRRIPLMIRLPHGKAAGTRTVTGGLLDLAPTLLSLLGRDGLLEPSLGHDLTGAAQRLVVFRDGAFTDGRTFKFTTDRGEMKCATRADMALDCGLLSPLERTAEELLMTSDRIVIGNLARPLVDRLRAKPPPPRPQTGLEVIAHRGLSLEFPENTMPAILGAIEAGADAIELDIHLSKDGVPVVFHDDTLERTSNGHGRLASKTVAELKRLDVGSWKGLQFEGTRLPTLQEVLAVTGESVPLLLDLKADGMAAAVAKVYAEAGVPAATAMIGGWNGEQRADFARHMPGARILRTEPAPAVWVPLLDRQLREQKVWGFELGDDWPSSFVAEARFKGWPVIAYTVNDESTMRSLIEMGVTAIETDDPKLLVRLKRELGLR